MALDPFADQVVLNLAFDGLDGSSIFKDQSKYGLGASPNIATIGTTTTNPPFSALPGIGSLLLNGSSNNFLNVFTKYIAFSSSDDFTFESRFRLSAANGAFIALFDGRGGVISAPLIFGFRLVSGTYRPEIYYSNSQLKYGALSCGAVDVWADIGMQRKAGVYEYYFGGTKDSLTYSGAVALTCNGDVATIGKLADGVYLNGQIAYIRITKGVARLADGYVPPVGPVAYKGLPLDGTAFVTIGNNAKKTVSGPGVDLVVINEYTTGIELYRGVPDATTGLWSATVPKVQIMVTYYDLTSTHGVTTYGPYTL